MKEKILNRWMDWNWAPLIEFQLVMSCYLMDCPAIQRIYRSTIIVAWVSMVTAGALKQFTKFKDAPLYNFRGNRGTPCNLTPEIQNHDWNLQSHWEYRMSKSGGIYIYIMAGVRRGFLSGRDFEIVLNFRLNIMLSHLKVKEGIGVSHK